MTNDQSDKRSDSNRESRATGTNSASTSVPASAKIGGVVVGIILLVAVAVGAYALVRVDSWGNGSSTLPERFQLDLSDQLAVPRDKIAFAETKKIGLKLKKPKAMAVGSDGAIYVAGDQVVEIIDPTGKSNGEIELDGSPTCIAMAPQSEDHPARLFVATARGISIYSLGGEMIGHWPPFGDESLVTAIGVTEHDAFVADAGQRVVLRCDAEGQVVNRIGQADPNRKMPGFVLPSPYFDLEVGSDEMLFVVNPGMRRVELYSFEGELQSYWGRAGSRLGDFFGCCNPAHLSRLPDGRFVTSEKGIPRIKIYTDAGDFDSVVAGPRELDVSAAAVSDARGDLEDRVFDVTVGPRGEVLVLDVQRRCVRVFDSKEAI